MLALPLEEGIDLLNHAAEQELEDRLHLQWAVQLPFMGMAGKVISFGEYKDRLMGKGIDTRSEAELLAELDAIEAEFEKGGVKYGNGDL